MKAKRTTETFSGAFEQRIVGFLFILSILSTSCTGLCAENSRVPVVCMNLEGNELEKPASKAASWLLSWQNDDGGWPSSVHTTQQRSSYPESTAEALLALLDYGIPIDSTPVTMAINYLANINLDEQKGELASLICHALASARGYETLFKLKNIA